MIDTEARRRMVNALERIADALESANAADPLLVIQKALEENQQAREPLPPWSTFSDMPPHIKRLVEAMQPDDDSNADMPPHIKRTLGVE